jgi:hypothetical protein
MNQGNWTAMALVSAVLGGVLAAPSAAGEVQVGARWGATRLEVDGSRLSSGNDVNDRLISSGLTLGYRWTRGMLLEIGTSGSGDFFDFLNINSLDHTWLAAGWQFDLNDRWRLTPKAGLVATELTSSEEDIFEGGEPVDRFDDTVPFLELTIGRRLGRYFMVGMYFRENFEEFGGSQMYGLQLHLTFD